MHHVLDWFTYYNIEYVKISLFDNKIQYNFSFDIDNLSVENINIDSIGKIWFHRASRIIPKGSIGQFNNKILYFHKDEIDAVYKSIVDILKKDIFVVHPNKVALNKINVLREAKKIGFSIPHSIITNDKNRIIDFMDTYDDVIIKPMSDCISMSDNSKTCSMFSTILDKELLKKQDNIIFPVMIQEKIEKSYEVRTFYLNGKTYSMAIFSQSDNSSKIDWRKSQQKNTVRNVPYEIPIEINIKLNALMKKIGLVTGSIDFIVSPNGEMIFLEINPVGQFGMVSELCNYSLYEKFANFIINDKNG